MSLIGGKKVLSSTFKKNILPTCKHSFSTLSNRNKNGFNTLSIVYIFIIVYVLPKNMNIDEYNFKEIDLQIDYFKPDNGKKGNDYGKFLNNKICQLATNRLISLLILQNKYLTLQKD
jgi:hypothetical protein